MTALERGPCVPLPLPPGAKILAKPVKLQLGAWSPLVYDATLEFEGLLWLRVEGGLGDGQRTNWNSREDWIAMVPGHAPLVSREPEWEYGVAITMEDAMRRARVEAAKFARFRRSSYLAKAATLSRGLRMLDG